MTAGNRRKARPLTALAMLALPLPAAAQDVANLSIELNAAQQQEQGCKLSFVLTNGHPDDISKAVFETVIFDAQGQVSRLTLFDFGTLPAGRPRVRQFVVPGTACEAIGRVLFNGADTCESTVSGACTKGLTLSSRTDIEVTG